MLNFTLDLDEDWFGRKSVFTVEGEQSWEPTEGPIEFPKKKGRGWQAYVDNPPFGNHLWRGAVHLLTLRCNADD